MSEENKNRFTLIHKTLNIEFRIEVQVARWERLTEEERQSFLKNCINDYTNKTADFLKGCKRGLRETIHHSDLASFLNTRISVTKDGKNWI